MEERPRPESESIESRREQAQASAILDAALDAVITIDHDGRVLDFNRAAEESFGYRRANILGRELAELIVPQEHREAHRRALARWTADGPTGGAGALLGKRLEVTAMRENGEIFPAELAISRLELPGAPVFTACIRDLSEQKRASELQRAADFRYRALVEELPLVVYVDAPDDPGSPSRYVSPQIDRLLGYDPETWLATPRLFESSLHADDRDAVIAAKRRARNAGGSFQMEYRMVRSDGRVVWVDDRSAVVRPPDGGPGYRQGLALDITHRKQAEDALHDAEARYRTLVEHLPLAVYVDAVDELSSNIYTSPQIEAMLGYGADEWQSDPQLFLGLLHPDDRERVLAAHARTHATREPLCIDYRLRASDGRIVWVHDEARVIVDTVRGIPVLQGYLLDVTGQHEAEEELRRQAFHDSLTGLANRALFADRVEHAIVMSAEGAKAAVLFLDLDDFKRVNDTLGHQAGDELLCQVGSRLVQALPPSHSVARLGGDEFAILVENVRDPARMAGLADRLLAALQPPFDMAGQELFVTGSIGIAVGDDADELLRSADVAMYQVKATGKAGYAFYAPAMDAALLGRLDLIADLRRARIEDEFVLLYQPTVDVRTGEVVGVEALVRWEHPVRGRLSPAEFVPAAEETGLINGIGAWVLREACEQTARWRRACPLCSLDVSVNVSGRQLEQPGFVEDVGRALEASGLPGSVLTVEITESVVVQARTSVVEALHGLKQLGVRVALDDFGTGYSSLSLLQQLPVDVLKVDRSFVQGIETVERRAELTRVILEVGRVLGLTVVAEGIETAGQVAVLRGLGGRLAQGFYFAHPLEASEVEALLTGPGRARLPAA